MTKSQSPKFPIIKLDEKNNQNRWIIGTPPAVEKESPFYSGNMQINHIKQPKRDDFFSKEQKHSHNSPIEEIYLVLNGTLDLEISNQTVTIKSKELLVVPSEVIHQIKDFSDDIDFLVIRAPVSNDKTKTCYELKKAKE